MATHIGSGGLPVKIRALHLSSVVSHWVFTLGRLRFQLGILPAARKGRAPAKLRRCLGGVSVLGNLRGPGGPAKKRSEWIHQLGNKPHFSRSAKSYDLEDPWEANSFTKWSLFLASVGVGILFWMCAWTPNSPPSNMV